MTASRQKSRFRIVAAALLLIVLGTGAGLLCVEAGVRIYDHHYGVPLMSATRPGALRFDPVLGWAPRESYRKVYTQYTHGGSKYLTRFSTDSSGRRVCGDAGPGVRRRILVVGDSFTQAWEVNDNREYYCVAGRSLGALVDGFGAGGYGTLQERMVVERLLPAEQPDLVVLQVCFNDFINNDFSLEKASWQNNHFQKRPYWRGGRVEFLLPNHFPTWFEVARMHSRVASNLYDGFVNRSAATAHSVEEDIEKAGADHPGFEAAAVETREIFGQLQQLLKGRDLVIFATDLREPYLSGFRQIFRELNIPFVEDGAAAVSRASALGVDVFARDGVHWNETGDRIAGEALAQAIPAHFTR